MDGTAQPALDQAFGYDENSRLTSIMTNAASWGIGYDANGHRTGIGAVRISVCEAVELNWLLADSLIDCRAPAV
ncbi:hypothetical protein [Rhizobacter sp. Root16D2]|uniref:hypothetical protein n=1 Tax=Rhizobacter sp. Root16D2 TaxID=1736479 RepID=UPI0006FCFF21|nr:hypothetical protein [Rhizobacter sp. Root16D2]KRB03777.1 hypothetical protein ASE08_13805 [Rhizobacter sp. Root16D2]